MDKIQALEIQDAMTPVVAGLKAKYNAMTKLSIKYNDSEVRITITLKTAPQGTDPRTEIYRQNALRYADLLGFDPKWLGLRNAKQEEFMGCDPNRRKYPIAIRRPDGKMALTTDTWLLGLKKHNNL